MYRIAVCDDEAVIRRQIREFLSRFSLETGEELEIAEFTSANELLFNYPAGLDLILLDIGMNGTDGMDAAKEIRRFNEDVCIIFITALAERAIEGYGVRAFGFVCKPVNYAELRHELVSAIHDISKRAAEYPVLTVQSGRSTLLLPTKDIYYCEVRDHSLTICYRDKVEEARITIAEMERKLKPYGFLRCHASYLVNRRFIRRVGANSIVLTNDKEIPVSQRRRKEFMDEIFDWYGM